MAAARFAVRSCSSQGLSLQPGNTGRTSRLLWDQAGADFLSLPPAPPHPSLRWDWKGNFWNARGRPFLWDCHPSQSQEALENLPRSKKKNFLKKSDCWGEFASRVSRPRGFGAASECFRGYPNQARRLPLPVPVGVQPSELGCQWGYSCIRMLRSSSSFPTAVTYCPQPEELLSCCPLDHKLQVKKASPWKQLTRKPFLAFFLEISLSLILSKGHLKPSSSCPFFSSS